ncbi:Desumoylating isopeptidase 1 [Grifola frondosa]|uniref:Desumoylating isopeptidase 1 n=1 Tax=Grifola frondosa TaxID=5627 RepID=A0A1C7M5R3_GRIFR|nr:Desumoylating isopeptidase 1 [Grifola frondosa]
MSNKVQLYVYDLSNGLAQQLSLQLTGRQINGIWHTSVVVFGQEIFYGQGICTTKPGQSHHGQPLQMLDMGDTAIDEETFQEYLTEMREHYTADKYHLLDWNCNSFTNDCVGFLTGNAIPSWIKDLPSDFLSTPFGAALRPTIDAMFSRPVPTPAPLPQPVTSPVAAAPDQDIAAALVQAVASHAMSSASAQTAPAPAPSTPGTSTLAAPIHMCTNPSSMHALLRTHRALIAFFTSATCPPCRMIAPLFEDLAHQKTHGNGSGQATGTAFVKVDMGVGLGGQVGAEWGVRVTPTFLFFLDGKKVHTHELKGANSAELRSQVDLLLFQAFPPHPHTSLALPAVESLSMNPILFTQVPNLDTVLTKLLSFVDAIPASPDIQFARQTLSTPVVSYLKSRFPPKGAPAGVSKSIIASPHLLADWADATRTLVGALSPAQLFPLVDMWRLALLDEVIGRWCANAPSPAVGIADPVSDLLEKVVRTLDERDSSGRNYILTVLRMVANAFASPALAQRLLSSGAERGLRAATTKVLVAALLHGDAAVRTAAASVAFNVAACLQRSRVDKIRGSDAAAGVRVEEDEEWEVELVSAVLEALGKEVQSEEVVHRLTAALAFLLRLSPAYNRGGI